MDEQEIRRAGVSYTVDTLRDYSTRFNGVQIFYLIGADNVPLLPQWREAGELARLAEFIVIPRPGETFAPLPAPFRGRSLRGWPVGISSSEIRARIKSGRSIAHLVPPAVAAAIRNNQLYL